ncbi:hypothetical protein ABPG75_011993 [Micractinium tetrahymenae]
MRMELAGPLVAALQLPPPLRRLDPVLTGQGASSLPSAWLRSLSGLELLKLRGGSTAVADAVAKLPALSRLAYLCVFCTSTRPLLRTPDMSAALAVRAFSLRFLALRHGPYQRSLRRLGLPWPALRSSEGLDALSGCTRLEQHLNAWRERSVLLGRLHAAARRGTGVKAGTRCSDIFEAAMLWKVEEAQFVGPDGVPTAAPENWDSDDEDRLLGESSEGELEAGSKGETA